MFLSSVVCYARGTQIRTPAGDVAIEALAEGDLVITVEGDHQATAPITWIGWRKVNLANHPRPEFVAPIISTRGVRLRPAVSRSGCLTGPRGLVDGKLVVARLLLNGMTITQDLLTRSVEYYHVELPDHAILLANGLAAESYLDTGNRAMFANGGLAMVLHPEFGVAQGINTWADDACAPLATSDAEVAPMWQRLATRAEALGYAPPDRLLTRDADLHLFVDGRCIRPMQAERGRYVFMVPSSAEVVRLRSRASAPADIAAYREDRRRLGVAVSRIAFRSGSDYLETAMDHPGLTRGWHMVEREGTALRRWTNGDALLAVPFASQAGARSEVTMLEVDTNCDTTYLWRSLWVRRGGCAELVIRPVLSTVRSFCEVSEGVG